MIKPENMFNQNENGIIDPPRITLIATELWAVDYKGVRFGTGTLKECAAKMEELISLDDNSDCVLVVGESISVMHPKKSGFKKLW